MSQRRRVTALALAAAAALVLAGCSGGTADNGDSGGDSTEPIKLTYAFFAPAVSFPSVQMQEWADQLTEKTDGQVEVELFVGGTLLSAGDIYDGVSQGVVDIGLDSPAYDTSRFAMSSVINVPMGITNPTTASKTFLDLLLEYQPEEYKDFEIITAFTTEASYLQTIDAVTKQSDLSGKTIRSAGSGVPVMEALGANPMGMSMADVSEALNTGVISGYDSSREVLKDFGTGEMVNYVTDYPMGISNSFVAVMDKAKFDSLPDNVKEAIGELRYPMMEFAAAEHERGLDAALEWAENEAGVEFIDVDPSEVDAWDQIMADRAQHWIDENSGASFDAAEVLERARELAAENS